MSQPERSTPPIDEQALADALNTRSATVQDVAYGEGVQYSTGRGSVRLEIFPGPGVTRLTAPDVRVELFGGTRVEVSDGGVEFSRTQPGQDASLTVVRTAGSCSPWLPVANTAHPREPHPHPPNPSPSLSQHPRHQLLVPLRHAKTSLRDARRPQSQGP